MIVSELIEQLKTFNPDAEITRPDSETILLSYICGNGVDKSNTPLVFIEMSDYEIDEDDYIGGYFESYTRA